MALETATYLSDLNAANPATGDGISSGDDHIRLLKAVLQATFPNLEGAVTASQDEINAAVDLAGVVGQVTLSGGSGVRNVILINDAGTYKVQITDTDHENPTTVFSISPTGATVFTGSVTGTSGSFSGALAAASATISGALASATLSVSGAASVGSLTSAGAVSGTSGSFSGALSGASVASAGDMDAVGDVSGATATISGAASVGSLVSAGAVSGTSGSFSGAVSGASGSFSGAVGAAGVNSSGDITATGTAKIKPGSGGIEFPDSSVLTTASSSYSPTATFGGSSLAASFPTDTSALKIKVGSGTTDGSGELSVTFATPFPTACIYFGPTPRPGASDNWYANVISRSASGASASVYEANAAKSGATCDWIAFGY